MATVGVGIVVGTHKRPAPPRSSWWVGVPAAIFAEVAKAESDRMNKPEAPQMPAKWPSNQAQRIE